MSDVALVQQLVTRYEALRQEIKKVIVGQDAVVAEVLTVCILWRACTFNWGSRTR